MASKAAFVKKMYQAGIKAGLTDAAARVMASQAAIESAYGERAPGNNFFAITKGDQWTGPTIKRADKDANGNPKTQEFRVYASPEEGIADRVAFMDSRFPGFNNAATTNEALAALQTGVKGKYYEAPRDKYESTVSGIQSKYLTDVPVSHPVPPVDVPFSPNTYLGGKQYGAPTGGVGVNADKLNPEFANRMAALTQSAENATGDKVSIFEGYRDPKRQAQLRANYLNKPIQWEGVTYAPNGKGYKAAAPGSSEHQLGMAADIRAGGDPDKAPSGPAFDYMRQHAAEYGLHWFGSSDPAHFEMPEADYKTALAGGNIEPFKLPTTGVATSTDISPTFGRQSVGGGVVPPPLPRVRPDPSKTGQMFTYGSKPPGMLMPGNIDLNNRPVFFGNDEQVQPNMAGRSFVPPAPQVLAPPLVQPGLVRSPSVEPVGLNAGQIGRLTGTRDIAGMIQNSAPTPPPMVRPPPPHAGGSGLQETRYEVRANPAYTAWMNAQTAPSAPTGGMGGVAGLSGIGGGVAGVIKPPTIAPPKTITVPVQVAATAPTVAPLTPTASPIAPPQPPGFNVLNFLGDKAKEAGTALGSTALGAIDNVKTGVGNTVQGATDLLKNDLIGTVHGRTILMNSMMGLPAPGSHDTYRYGDTQTERNASAAARDALRGDTSTYAQQTTARAWEAKGVSPAARQAFIRAGGGSSVDMLKFAKTFKG